MEYAFSLQCSEFNIFIRIIECIWWFISEPDLKRMKDIAGRCVPCPFYHDATNNNNKKYSKNWSIQSSAVAAPSSSCLVVNKFIVSANSSASFSASKAKNVCSEDKRKAVCSQRIPCKFNFSYYFSFTSFWLLSHCWMLLLQLLFAVADAPVTMLRSRPLRRSLFATSCACLQMSTAKFHNRHSICTLC